MLIANDGDGVAGLVTDTAQGWTQSALARLAELQAPGAAERVAQDLKRWLPSSWPIDMATAASMLASAVEQLKRGIDMMHSAAAAPTPND